MNNEAQSSISEESASVQSHLVIEQGVIQRMAENSASCKAWCVTLVSAILVVIADKNKPDLAYLAILPTLVFFALDAYYLGLERMFRDSYRIFIKRLHEKKISSNDLFSIKPTGSQIKNLLRAIISFSIYPFYIGLLLTVFVIKWAVI
jgi:hypothetical protein